MPNRLTDASSNHRRTVVWLLGSPVDALTQAETLSTITRMIRSGKPHQHVVINAAKMVTMRDDTELYNDVLNADLINADGMAVVWASRILGDPGLPERVTGIDLMESLVAKAEQEGWRPYFLGAQEEVLQKTMAVYRKRYPNLKIAGFRNGYFDTNEEHDVVKGVRDSNADILFVAMPSPVKERFLGRWKMELGVPFQMGVGGSFDVIAGHTARAPRWMQSIGLEWFYRFAQEPRRMWRRYLTTNSRFIWMLMRELFKQKTSRS